MICKKCGAKFEGNFCPKCGTPAEKELTVCPKCGQERGAGDRYCPKCGYDFARSDRKESVGFGAKAAEAVKKVPKKAWAAIAAIVLVVIAIIVLVSVLSNKFRIGVVEKIEIGDSRESVIELLGEPYDYQESSSTFTYYSNNYLKLLEKNDSFDPDDIEDWGDFEDAFNEAMELEQKLQTEEYKYIEVRFDGEGCVESVFFDASRTEKTKLEPKTVKKYEVLETSGSEVTYTVRYQDGSYMLGITTGSLEPDNDTSVLLWHDRFGNELKTKTNYKIGDSWYYDMETDTVVITSDDFDKRGWPMREDEHHHDYFIVKNAILADGVTAIPDGAFDNCPNLCNVTIPDGVTTIGASAFHGCDSLTSISIPDGVTEIGDYAFYDCSSLTSVTIPDSVTSIGGRAFESCGSLMSITIPDSVTFIGDGAFSWCSSLTSITVSEGNPVYHSDGNCLIEMESKTLIAGCETSVIPADGSVTSIGDSAFYGCDRLTNITIPDSVTSIDDSAFYGCDRLTNITIPDSVTSIGDSAFYGCDRLTNITIPDGVTFIGREAFYNCDSLTSVTIPDGVTFIGREAFWGCDRLTNITIPDSVTSIGYEAFYNCDSLTSVTIPDSVTSIGDSAFSGCDSLTSITVNVGNLVYHSEGNCLIETKSKTLIVGCGTSVIPADGSVTSIGDYAFCNFDSLTSVTIPDSVTSIDDYAFYHCDGLTSVTIPDSVTTIGDRAFYYCGSLKSVTIGEGVNSIGEGAFAGCESLETVYYRGSEEEWNEIEIEIREWDDELKDAEIVFNYKGE